MSEPITLQDKKRALKLAYQIVTDKRNVNRYGGTALVRKDSPEMFTYSDMTSVLRAMFDELVDAQEKPAMQKPLTKEELLELINPGDEVVAWAEANGFDGVHPNLWYRGMVQGPDVPAACTKYLNWNGYGKTWRAWAARPTDEERAAAPWEE